MTETTHAAAHLTPASRGLLPDALLDARVGRSTLAGSLNDQIRFRVDRTGPVAEWKIEPDSPNTVALMQSKAGPELLRQLRTATDSTGSLGAVSNLKGFILAEDTESVLAGRVVSWLDDPADTDGRALAKLGAAGETAEAGKAMQSWKVDTGSLATAGAWNSRGWITFLPDTSRAMLTAAGAYAPSAETEPKLRQAGMWPKYLSGNGPHEVQHSVSSPSPTAYRGAARWMEEGAANVFTRTPTFHTKNAKASGLSPERYAARLANEPNFDPGWGTWTRPTLPTKEQEESDKNASRNYGDSQVVLRDLVRLAGGDFRSNAGKETAFQLLQAKSMRYTPGVLAQALIDRHGLEQSVYDRLRERIKVAVDLPKGAASIAEEFGIGS